MKESSQFKTHQPADNGPTLQVSKAAGDADVGLTLTPVPNGGSVTSQPVPSGGYKSLSVGLKSTQPGAINVQRYLDAAGTIPVGAVATAALVANTANSVSIADGIPFLSFTIQVTNTGASPGTISNFALLLQAV